MKFTESTIICSIRDRVACIIKVNVKALMGTDSFLQMFMDE